MRKVLVGILLLCISTPLYGGSREQARRMHDRIAGVPPSETVLEQMATLLDAGDVIGAAQVAMAGEEFYRITLKNLFMRWTNVDAVMDLPLNDYVATAIGLVRDDVSFDQILYGDILYTARDGMAGIPAYSLSSNEHYESFENSGANFLTDLVAKQQSVVNGLGTAAGVLTTRAFGEAFYSAGTNRRPVAYTMSTFTCKEMEQLNDVTRPDPFVRRDVDRAPGGDPLAYKNKCSGCHSGMDPLSKAFAHVDFVDGTLTMDESVIPEKINRNGNVFPAGFVTEDNAWLNLWVDGQNATLGWNGANSGTGLASFGQMISASDAFAGCMAEKVFDKLCLRAPADDIEKQQIEDLGKKFRDEGFKVKSLVADTIQLCID